MQYSEWASALTAASTTGRGLCTCSSFITGTAFSRSHYAFSCRKVCDSVAINRSHFVFLTLHSFRPLTCNSRLLQSVQTTVSRPYLLCSRD